MKSKINHQGIKGALLLIITMPLAAFALTPSQVFDKVRDSVLVIHSLDANGNPISQGSGVILPNGKVATNCHVVEGGTRFQVGRGSQFVPAALYAGNGDKDLCLLDAKGISGNPAQLGSASSLKVGVPVYAVGAPRGLELSLSDGIVSQLRGGPPPFIQTTAAISPGSSGGGLFDSEGRLVGFTTLYIENAQSLNFAMPVEWLGEIKPHTNWVKRGHSQTDWLKRAMALSGRNDWQGLLVLCRQWTNSQPQNHEAWANLGAAYSMLNRHTEAINAFRQAVRINPDAKRWTNLGVTYYLAGNQTAAIDAIRQSLRIDSESAYSWCWLGAVYNHLNRYTDAIYATRQALRIEPENARAWYEFGVASHLTGNTATALDAVQVLRRLDSDKAEKLFNQIVPR